VAIAFAAGAGVGYRSGVGDVAQLEKTLARIERLQVMMPKIERFVELSDELDRLQGARSPNRRHGESPIAAAQRRGEQPPPDAAQRRSVPVVHEGPWGGQRGLNP
jgi:hypothetical protein